MPENEINRSLGRIEGKVDLLIDHFKQHADDDQEAFAALALRLAAQEKKLNWFSGVGAAIVFFSGFLQYFKLKI